MLIIQIRAYTDHQPIKFHLSKQISFLLSFTYNVQHYGYCYLLRLSKMVEARNFLKAILRIQVRGISILNQQTAQNTNNKEDKIKIPILYSKLPRI